MKTPMTVLAAATFALTLVPGLAGVVRAQMIRVDLPEGGLPLTPSPTKPLVTLRYDRGNPMMTAPGLGGSLRVPIVRLQPVPAARAFAAPIVPDALPDIPGIGKTEPAEQTAAKPSDGAVRAARASLVAMGAAGADHSWIWSDFWQGAGHHEETDPDQPRHGGESVAASVAPALTGLSALSGRAAEPFAMPGFIDRGSLSLWMAHTLPHDEAFPGWSKMITLSFGDARQNLVVLSLPNTENKWETPKIQFFFRSDSPVTVEIDKANVGAASSLLDEALARSQPSVRDRDVIAEARSRLAVFAALAGTTLAPAIRLYGESKKPVGVEMSAQARIALQYRGVAALSAEEMEIAERVVASIGAVVKDRPASGNLMIEAGLDRMQSIVLALKPRGWTLSMEMPPRSAGRAEASARTQPSSPSGRAETPRVGKDPRTSLVSILSMVAAGVAGVSLALLNYLFAIALMPPLVLAVGIGIKGIIKDLPSRERSARLAWSCAASLGVMGAAGAAFLLHAPQLAAWTAFFSFVPATLALDMASLD